MHTLLHTENMPQCVQDHRRYSKILRAKIQTLAPPRVSELEDENQSLNKSLEERNNESAESSGAGASESLVIQELEDELAGAK